MQVRATKGGVGGGGGGFFAAAAQGDDDDDEDSLSADAPFIIPANSGGRRFGSDPHQSKQPFAAPSSSGVATKKKGRKKMPALVSAFTAAKSAVNCHTL